MTIPALTKPVDELTAEDIRGLVTNQIQEGEHVEFKEGLSSSGRANRGNAGDGITRDDQKDLLKEIVAFANAYGGRLFLGIAEQEGNPPTADQITPISDCEDKADRLRRAFGNLIDPPMLRLDLQAIETETDGSGVIVFDVPKSIRAPHMSNRDYRSYRRRRSESVPMDMRDIQDMTLRSASRFSEIEAEFGRRRREFDVKAVAYQNETDKGYCFRLSFVPLDDVDLGDVHGIQSVRPEILNFKAHYESEATSPFSVSAPGGSSETRPVVRGTRIQYYIPTELDMVPTWEYTLWSNAGMEVWYCNSIVDSQGQSKVGIERFVAWLSNGLRNVDRVRKQAGLPSLNYGLEAHLKIFGQSALFLRFHEPLFQVNTTKMSVGDHIYP